MPKITVVQAFTLNLAAGQKRFEVGEQEVSKEIAEHWYTQEHTQKSKAKAKKGAGAADDTDDEDDAPGGKGGSTPGGSGTTPTK